MSTIHPGSPRDDADDSPFTVEDSGSTTDAADLVGGERARQNDAALSDGGRDGDAATRVTSTEPLRTDHDDDRSAGGAHAVTGSESTSAAPVEAPAAGGSAAPAPDDGRGGLTSLDDDGSIAHVFDQTNGVIEGVEGESDGTSEGDELSRGERAGENSDLFHDGLVDRGGEGEDVRRTGA